MNQSPALLPASNPFVRGYDNLRIERLIFDPDAAVLDGLAIFDE